MNKLQIHGQLYHVHGLTELILWKYQQSIFLKYHKATYIFSAIRIKIPINILHTERNHLKIHMDPQRTKKILNKKNKAGGFTSTDLKIHCSYSDEQNRQPGNRPIRQYPAVFVVVFVCLVLFFIEAIRIHIEEKKFSSIIGPRKIRYPKQEKLNPIFIHHMITYMYSMTWGGLHNVN